MSIPVHCAHTRLVDPNTLEPNPANPNRHSAHQIQLLASIIQDQGWRNPVTVSKRSGLIVRGHGRLEAALLLGCEVIPVDEQDYASEAEELADLLADNRLSELAELDEDDLRRVLKSIGETDPDFDLELTGFMEDEIRKLMEDDTDPAEDLETIPRMACHPLRELQEPGPRRHGRPPEAIGQIMSAIHVARHVMKRERNYVGHSLWARGFFVDTVGRDTETIRRYIREQEREDRGLDQLEFPGNQESNER